MNSLDIDKIYSVINELARYRQDLVNELARYRQDLIKEPARYRQDLFNELVECQFSSTLVSLWHQAKIVKTAIPLNGRVTFKIEKL